MCHLFLLYFLHRLTCTVHTWTAPDDRSKWLDSDISFAVVSVSFWMLFELYISLVWPNQHGGQKNQHSCQCAFLLSEFLTKLLLQDILPAEQRHALILGVSMAVCCWKHSWQNGFSGTVRGMKGASLSRTSVHSQLIFVWSWAEELCFRIRVKYHSTETAASVFSFEDWNSDPDFEPLFSLYEKTLRGKSLFRLCFLLFGNLRDNKVIYGTFSGFNNQKRKPLAIK